MGAVAPFPFSQESGHLNFIKMNYGPHSSQRSPLKLGPIMKFTSKIYKDIENWPYLYLISAVIVDMA